MYRIQANISVKAKTSRIVIFLSSLCTAVINRVRNREDPPYRPLLSSQLDIPEKIAALITACWHETPDCRPDMHAVVKRVYVSNGGR